MAGRRLPSALNAPRHSVFPPPAGTAKRKRATNDAPHTADGYGALPPPQPGVPPPFAPELPIGRKVAPMPMGMQHPLPQLRIPPELSIEPNLEIRGANRALDIQGKMCEDCVGEQPQYGHADGSGTIVPQWCRLCAKVPDAREAALPDCRAALRFGHVVVGGLARNATGEKWVRQRVTVGGVFQGHAGATRAKKHVCEGCRVSHHQPAAACSCPHHGVPRPPRAAAQRPALCMPSCACEVIGRRCASVRPRPGHRAELRDKGRARPRRRQRDALVQEVRLRGSRGGNADTPHIPPHDSRPGWGAHIAEE